MTEFFAMGGYAAYVWGAFGVSLAALAILFWMTRNALRNATERARRFVRSSQGESA